MLHGDHVTIFGRWYRIPALVSLMKYPRAANSVFLGVALAWIMTTLESTLTLRLSKIFKYNSMQAGIVFLALAISAIVELVFGMLSDKYRPRYIVSSGISLMSVPFIYLRFPQNNSVGDRVLLIALIGRLCLTAVTSPTMAEMAKAVTKIEAKHPGIYGKAKDLEKHTDCLIRDIQLDHS